MSVKTVSRVMSGAPNVRPATELRVREAAKTLNFRPNYLARALREQRAGRTIGLVIEDLADPFSSSLARGAERIAREHGYLLLIVSSEGESRQETGLVESLLERRCEGILLVPSSENHDYLRAEVERGTSIVFVDRPPQTQDYDSVVIDNYGGSFGAVTHLVSQGHRRIALIAGNPNLHTTAERIRGYTNTLKFADIVPDPALLVTDAVTAAEAENRALRLLGSADPPTAIFAASNRAAAGTLAATASAQATVALISFGDLELGAHLATPLSAVVHDPLELGIKSAQMLFERIEHPSGPARQVILPTRLVTRGSGEIPPSSCEVPQ